MLVPLETINVPAGGGVRRKIDLPASHLLRWILVDVLVNATNTGAVTYYQDALSRLFQQISYYRGNTPDIDGQGRHLRHYFSLFNQGTDRYTEIGGGAGAVTGRWRFIIPRSDPYLLQPDRTADDMRLGANPRLEFVIGGIAAATAGTATLDSMTIESWADVAEIGPDVPAAQFTATRIIRTFDITDLAVNALDARRRFNPGELTRALMLMVTNRATPFARNDARVSDVQLVINHQPRGFVDWEALRTLNMILQGYGSAAFPDGIALLNGDPNRSVDPRTMWDLRGARQVEFGFNTDGTLADVGVVQEQLVLPPEENLEALAAMGVL